jgi:hypothetical protein
MRESELGHSRTAGTRFATLSEVMSSFASSPDAGRACKPLALEQREFLRLQTQLKERCGVDMSEGKRTLMQHRLGYRMRALELDRFDQYLPLIADGPESCYDPAHVIQAHRRCHGFQ